MKRRIRMGILFVAVGLFVGYGAAWLASDEVRYLTRAAAEEARILERRRSLDEVIADPRTDPATRGLIALVKDVRAYADTLGLEAGDTYTTYTDVGRDTLLLVLTAAPRDCVCPHTWKYPIVGRVPYKGFFDPKMARKAAGELEGRGFDIYLRPSAAFSTLGWFNDPLLSTALARDSMELAATVFHELAHNTLWIQGATAFNESFAQYVGYRSAEAFFLTRGDTAAARRAALRWADEQVLGDYYRELLERVEGFYRSRPDSAALDSGRVELGRWAAETLSGPIAARLGSVAIGPQPARPINNARLIGVRLYRTNLAWFDRWHVRQQNDVRQGVATLRELLKDVEPDSAFARLERAVRAGG
jgi:predicted aminopeptidase